MLTITFYISCASASYSTQYCLRQQTRSPFPDIRNLSVGLIRTIQQQYAAKSNQFHQTTIEKYTIQETKLNKSSDKSKKYNKMHGKNKQQQHEKRPTQSASLKLILKNLPAKACNFCVRTPDARQSFILFIWIILSHFFRISLELHGSWCCCCDDSPSSAHDSIV